MPLHHPVGDVAVLRRGPAVVEAGGPVVTAPGCRVPADPVGG